MCVCVHVHVFGEWIKKGMQGTGEGSHYLRQDDLLVLLLVGCHLEPGWLEQCHLTGTTKKPRISIPGRAF